MVNHMKKSIIAGVVALSLLSTFTGCGKNESEKSDVSIEYDVSIGYLNSTAHLLAFVAQEEGYFKDEGVNATLTQFSSAAELSNGLESGKLDVAFIGSVSKQWSRSDYLWRCNDKWSWLCHQA